MTDREKIIVSAYTGVLMCDFNNLHKYIEDILGRPVFTHEMADKSVLDEIKEKSREEFLAICNTTEPHWIPCSERLPDKDGYYLTTTMYYQVYRDYWNGDNWDRTEMVIAWMDMPEPYQKEGDQP